MKNLVTTLILMLSILSCKKHIVSIEIDKKNIVEMKISMKKVQDLLEKTSFDSIAIKNYYIQSLIENELLYSNSKNIDSIRSEIEKDFNYSDYTPLRKEIYKIREGFIILNNRKIAKNLVKFLQKKDSIPELKLLNKTEKLELIDCFKVLNKNKIWSCRKILMSDYSFYEFEYSNDNLYYSSETQKYLFLKSDVKKIINKKYFLDNYLYLEELNDLMLYSGK